MNIGERELTAIVRQVVSELVAQKRDVVKNVDPSGVMSINFDDIKLDKFDTGNPSDKVFLKDVLSLEESPRLGCGVMQMDESAFDWTLKYDEVDYVVEGTLEVIVNGRKTVANAGEIIFIPKNSSIVFSAPEHARFIYVTYPADWANQGKPEEMTHERGNTLVDKTHPLIALRGALDAFQAQVIELQCKACELGNSQLAEELEEVLSFARTVLSCEVLGKKMEAISLLGLSADELREWSHNPRAHFGKGHIVPHYSMGALCAGINRLRTEARKVELAAVRAFKKEGGEFERNDIILALNRLSSCLYIMIYRHLPKEFSYER